MRINKEKGHLQDWITQLWVKATGRRINPAEISWLHGPIGDTDIISDKFITAIAAQENLDIIKNHPGSGLLDTFDELELTTAEKLLINKRIIDFYQHTSNYHFEVWSEWKGIFRPFGWLLSFIFSKRLQQLNLPLSALDAAKGIESNIIKLTDKNTKATRWTVWYRILKSTNHVIYSGVYTSCTVPNFHGRFLKVLFPLPNGNAVVIMRKEILEDGSLKLISDGRKFGDNGFYFTLTDHKTKHWARFVRSMHEWIRVYEDEDKMLRADHNLYFYGLPFLHLHYKMAEK